MVQNLTLFIKQRWAGWLFIIALVVLAYQSTKIAIESRPKEVASPSTRVIRHAPDFTGENIVLWRTSEDKRTRYTIKAVKITHYRDDLSSDLEQPSVVVFTQNVPDASPAPVPVKPSTIRSEMRADTAHLLNEGEQINLKGNVRVVRTMPDAPTNTLLSETLTLFPDKDLVTTKSPATFTQGRNRTSAQTGLEYSHSDMLIHLNGRVRTVITP